MQTENVMKRDVADTNTITGIIRKKLVRDVLLRSYVALGFTPEDTEASEDQIATLIWNRFQETVPLAKQIRCLSCKGVANEEDELCPYCGHDEGSPVIDEEAQTMTTVQTTKNVNEKNGKAMDKAMTGSMRDDTRPASAVKTERDLDEAVSRVQNAKGAAALGHWHLGREVAIIYEAQLWKQRTVKDDKGHLKPRWNSFEAFCNQELGLTPQHARDCMKVATKYSEEQVRAFGVAKLGLLLMAPTEDQPAIREKIEQGASRKEIAREVRRARKERETKSASAPQQAAAHEAAAKAKKAQSSKEKTITIASMLGSQSIKLYKKPASMRNIDFKNLARAKKIVDEPFGRLELANDVVMFLTVQMTAGGDLVAKVVFQRFEARPDGLNVVRAVE